LFSIGHFYQPDEAVRRNEGEQGLRVTLTGLVPIRRNPHPAA
jgi:hypothetical protein